MIKSSIFRLNVFKLICCFGLETHHLNASFNSDGNIYESIPIHEFSKNENNELTKQLIARIREAKRSMLRDEARKFIVTNDNHKIFRGMCATGQCLCNKSYSEREQERLCSEGLYRACCICNSSLSIGSIASCIIACEPQPCVPIATASALKLCCGISCSTAMLGFGTCACLMCVNNIIDNKNEDTLDNEVERISQQGAYGIMNEYSSGQKDIDRVLLKCLSSAND